MSLIKTNGLIIKEQKVSENDRLITILTAENGLVKAFAPNSLKLKSKNLSATQLLSYSRLNLYKSRDTYKVNDAQCIELFYKLRSNIINLSLVGYFCELISNLAPIEEDANSFLSLMLNSMYLICEDKLSSETVKPVFELKLCMYAGYMPELTGCHLCHEDSSSEMYFDVGEGVLYCEKCLHDRKNAFILTNGVLAAMRHILIKNDKMMFAFRLPKKSLDELNSITESFVMYQTDRQYKTLEFYKNMKF